MGTLENVSNYRVVDSSVNLHIMLINYRRNPTSVCTKLLQRILVENFVSKYFEEIQDVRELFDRGTIEVLRSWE